MLKIVEKLHTSFAKKSLLATFALCSLLAVAAGGGKGGGKSGGESGGGGNFFVKDFSEKLRTAVQKAKLVGNVKIDFEKIEKIIQHEDFNLESTTKKLFLNDLPKHAINIRTVLFGYEDSATNSLHLFTLKDKSLVPYPKKNSIRPYEKPGPTIVFDQEAWLEEPTVEGREKLALHEAIELSGQEDPNFEHSIQLLGLPVAKGKSKPQSMLGTVAELFDEAKQVPEATDLVGTFVGRCYSEGQAELSNYDQALASVFKGERSSGGDGGPLSVSSLKLMVDWRAKVTYRATSKAKEHIGLRIGIPDSDDQWYLHWTVDWKGYEYIPQSPDYFDKANESSTRIVEVDRLLGFGSARSKNSASAKSADTAQTSGPVEAPRKTYFPAVLGTDNLSVLGAAVFEVYEKVEKRQFTRGNPKGREEYVALESHPTRDIQWQRLYEVRKNGEFIVAKVSGAYSKGLLNFSRGHYSLIPGKALDESVYCYFFKRIRP